MREIADVKQNAANNTTTVIGTSSLGSSAAVPSQAVGISNHALTTAFAELRRRTQNAMSMIIANMVGHEAFLHFNAEASANIRPVMLHVWNDADAERSMSARILFPSLMSYLIFDFVFQKPSPLEWLEVDYVIAQTARSFGDSCVLCQICFLCTQADEWQVRCTRLRMDARTQSVPVFQNEELELHTKKAFRSMFESLFDHMKLSDGLEPLALAREPCRALQYTEDRNGQGRPAREAIAWQQLRGYLIVILHDALDLRMRMDVDSRQFDVYWPKIVPRMTLSVDQVMNNADAYVEGERDVEAVMFPGVRVRQDDRCWAALLKAAILLSPTASPEHRPESGGADY